MKKSKRIRKKEPRQALDHGTEERWRRGGGLELAETIEAGILQARARYECLLDLLHKRGDLGEGPSGSRRHDAGLWLRRLYLRTHGERLVWSYDQLGRDHSEMSDEQARVHGLYRRTMLAMGPEFGVLRRACCDDRPTRLSLLRRALDQLADWRGL